MDILEKFRDLEIRKTKKSKVIGVIAGGISSERKVSLKTGKKIYKALEDLHYNTLFIDPKDKLLENLKRID
ncbi:MAG: hypothetical protein R6U35_02900, partial [Candidatus Humimicrobiaceae bacterium]